VRNLLPEIDVLLFLLVTGVVLIALAVDLAVVVVWMRKRKP